MCGCCVHVRDFYLRSILNLYDTLGVSPFDFFGDDVVQEVDRYLVPVK